MTTPIREGQYVRHEADGYVGTHAGFTRLAHLITRPGDLRAVRVELPDGEVRVAPERSLEPVAASEYGKYAVQLGIRLTGRHASAVKAS